MPIWLLKLKYLYQFTKTWHGLSNHLFDVRLYDTKKYNKYTKTSKTATKSYEVNVSIYENLARTFKSSVWCKALWYQKVQQVFENL